MTVDLQIAFNIAVALIGVLGGWILKALADELKSLRAADINHTDKIQRMEILVAGDYVKKSDLERFSNAVFSKLDKIEAKIYDFHKGNSEGQ